ENLTDSVYIVDCCSAKYCLECLYRTIGIACARCGECVPKKDYSKDSVNSSLAETINKFYESLYSGDINIGSYISEAAAVISEIEALRGVSTLQQLAHLDKEKAHPPAQQVVAGNSTTEMESAATSATVASLGDDSFDDDDGSVAYNLCTKDANEEKLQQNGDGVTLSSPILAGVLLNSPSSRDAGTTVSRDVDCEMVDDVPKKKHQLGLDLTRVLPLKDSSEPHNFIERTPEKKSEVSKSEEQAPYVPSNPVDVEEKSRAGEDEEEEDKSVCSGSSDNELLDSPRADNPASPEVLSATPLKADDKVGTSSNLAPHNDIGRSAGEGAEQLGEASSDEEPFESSQVRVAASPEMFGVTPPRLDSKARRSLPFQSRIAARITEKRVRADSGEDSEEKCTPTKRKITRFDFKESNSEDEECPENVGDNQTVPTDDQQEIEESISDNLHPCSSESQKAIKNIVAAFESQRERNGATTSPGSTGAGGGSKGILLLCAKAAQLASKLTYPKSVDASHLDNVDVFKSTKTTYAGLAVGEASTKNVAKSQCGDNNSDEDLFQEDAFAPELSQYSPTGKFVKELSPMSPLSPLSPDYTPAKKVGRSMNERKAGRRVSRKRGVDKFMSLFSDEESLPPPLSPQVEASSSSSRTSCFEKETNSMLVRIPTKTLSARPAESILKPEFKDSSLPNDDSVFPEDQPSARSSSNSSSSSKRDATTVLEEILDLGTGAQRELREIELPHNAPASDGSERANLSTSFSSVGKEKRNAKGETTLHIACRTGNVQKVKELLESGADFSATDYAGWTPLHDAISGKGTDVSKGAIVQLLCRRGCNVNAMGGIEEDTPLHEAAAYGLERIVEILISFGAVPTIRNADGKLPRDVAFNDFIIKILDNRANNEGCSLNAFTMANLALEDPSLHQIRSQKAVLYFNFEVSERVLNEVMVRLNLKVADKLTEKVTHIIYETSSENEDDRLVPFSWEYLVGLGKGLWQLSYQWICKSLYHSRCQPLTDFEISGCNEPAEESFENFNYQSFCGTTGIPGLARVNREKGNPGLFDGFTFYLYKSCGSGKLTKKSIGYLAILSGAKITNREPNPETIDPLDFPSRFHTLEDSSHKFTLTSHVILFADDEQPPEIKRFNMEHVKTMNLNWLVDCLGHFQLVDPENYL
ncbi:BRCA1-associated RING domain protein 1, partial [Orchesella cincta]